LLAARGRYREAIAQYERALALRPNLAAAWKKLGEAKRSLGDIAGAGAADQRARAITAQ
jgi:tetratricopeptide (TPR) repeat protein